MTFAADSVSATPFRGGFATLNHPLGHSKAREEEKFLHDSSRVVDGADPYKTKTKYAPVAKIKNILFIQSAHRLPRFSTQIQTARFAIARHGTAAKPSRRGGVSNL